MYSINRATVSPLSIINTSGESANAENHPKSSGFDEIFNRTMQDLASPKTGSDSAAESRPEKKAPKEEIQSIEPKESLQTIPEKTDRQAGDTRNERDRSEGDKTNTVKDAISVKDQEKAPKNPETAVKIEVKKDKPAETEKNAKKDRDPMMRDIERFLAVITAAIDRMSAQTKSPVMMNDLAKMKDDIRDIVSSDKKGPRLQAMIDSLKDKISLFETRHALNLNTDDRAQIASIKTAMHDLNKKIQPEKEHRQAPVAAEAFHEKNAALPEKTVVSKENASGEQNRGDAKQNQQWNVSMLKSNFERNAERAAQEKPADTSRFRAQLDTIIDRARVVVHDSKNATFSLRLHPKDLGGLHINLGLEHGVLHGRFLVETPEAKTLLLQNLELVRQELAQSGLALGEFQVNVRGQREEYRGDTPEKAKRPDIQLKEISAEYATNTLMGHDGSINLII